MGAKAYSYRRFSHEKQAAGSSLARQLKMAQDYCQRHGLELDETLTFEDAAVSAWKGKNRQEGALSVFLQAISDGLVQPGSLLLVESFDRLSREGWLPTAGLCQQIANAGVPIVILKSQRVYDKEMLASLEGGVTLVVEASLATEESNQKSRRVKEAWVGRIHKAVEEGANIAEIVPSWLTIPPKVKGVSDTRKITFNEERKDIVLRRVNEYLAGKGKQAIARDLNADKVPCFSDTQTGRKRKAQWWEGTIIRIINNPAICGIYKDRTDYFPAVITVDQWNDIREMERSSHRRMSPRHNVLANPLSGVACCLCGSIMTRICTTIKTKRYYRLTCMAKKSGKAKHTRYSIQYDKALALVLKWLPTIIDEAPIVDAAFESEIQRLNDELVSVQAQIDRLVAAIEQGLGSVIVNERIMGLEAHRKDLAAQLTQTQEEASLASPAAQKRHRRELVNVLVGENIDPQDVNAKLKLVIKSITFDRKGSIREWTFVDGSVVHGSLDEMGEELAEIADNRLVRD